MANVLPVWDSAGRESSRLLTWGHKTLSLVRLLLSRSAIEFTDGDHNSIPATPSYPASCHRELLFFSSPPQPGADPYISLLYLLPHLPPLPVTGTHATTTVSCTSYITPTHYTAAVTDVYGLLGFLAL